MTAEPVLQTLILPPDTSYVDHPAALEKALAILSKAPRLALDTEADSLHHYREKVCLIQISDSENHFIIDPLQPLDFSGLLNLFCEKPLVLHGADYDLRLLRRCHCCAPSNIFDTAQAAQLLGYTEFGLAALLKRHFGVDLPKGSQRADWSRRPLTQEMLDYAVKDVSLLLQLSDAMMAELIEAGRVDWQRQACERMLRECSVDREVDEDERWRVKGWRKLRGRQLELLREMWMWREREAELADRPPFMVLVNETLVELAAWIDANPEKDVDDYPRLPRNLRGRRLSELRRYTRKALALPAADWPRIPKAKSHPPDPAANGRLEKLKVARNALAEEHTLSPGVLAPNSALLWIARLAPSGVDELLSAGGLLPWQAHLVGERLLKAMNEPLPVAPPCAKVDDSQDSSSASSDDSEE